jgi:hypothetical protein
MKRGVKSPAPIIPDENLMWFLVILINFKAEKSQIKQKIIDYLSKSSIILD